MASNLCTPTGKSIILLRGYDIVQAIKSTRAIVKTKLDAKGRFNVLYNVTTGHTCTKTDTVWALHNHFVHVLKASNTQYMAHEKLDFFISVAQTHAGIYFIQKKSHQIARNHGSK